MTKKVPFENARNRSLHALIVELEGIIYTLYKLMNQVGEAFNIYGSIVPTGFNQAEKILSDVNAKFVYIKEQWKKGRR